MCSDTPSEPTIQAVPISPGEGWSNSRKIGPYKLLQRIGEGGMGEVWMAEQEQPIRRRVALKLIKTGADNRQVIARFEAERQALAMMNHENIAKVFDAGATETGTPFVVMELVQGIPFTSYCDKQKLTIHERLELFVPVCEAVQHAHQKGVIHRDLKPSNVLVGLYDGKPVPKVIDFGLAKAMGDQARLTDKTMFTEFGQVVGTVQYMSPEQAEMNQLDVDTRTDIYSLGVMLYELLTGSTPLDAESLKKQAILEILESIRSKDPPRPSIRLSSISHEAASGVSTQRRIEIGKLKSFLSGELDWIVMKALEKDRTRRYGSASDFAADLERFLMGDVVAARPPSASYRIQKYVAKNRGLVVSATIIATLMWVTLIGISWFAVEANHAKGEVSKKATQLSQAVEELKETNATLAKTNAEKTSLVVQGSQLAFQRGIEAWHAGLPADAIAHWTNSIQMFPANDEAKHWLDHALLSHQQHGWNPPYWIIGGDEETAKAVLSQDGKYVALQSASDNTVTLVDVYSKQRLASAHSVVGVIDDLYMVGSEQFRLLTVDVEAKQATVWGISEQKISQISLIQGAVDEGELEFSPGGNFLVRQLEGDRHTLAYRVSNGEKFEFELADPGKTFFLTYDDTAAVAKSESGYVARSTAGSRLGDYRELQMPDFGVVPMSAEGFEHAPVAAPVVDPPSVAPAEASIRPIPSFPDRGKHGAEPDPGALVSRVVQVAEPQVGSQQGAISLGFRQSGRSRTVLTGKRLDECVPGSAFIALSPFANGDRTQLLISGFDLETGNTDLRLLDLQAPAKSFLNGSSSPSHLFVHDLKNFLAITQIESVGGCGPGVECNKSRFRLDLVWNDARYQHSKSPGIEVFDAVIDPMNPRVLLLSRPLPDPQIQLYDFSNPLLEPMKISVPHTSRPSSRLESYFVGQASDVVCRFARNAVGVWNTAETNPLCTQLELLDEETKLDVGYQYEVAERGEVTKILDLAGDARDVTLFRILSTFPVDGASTVSQVPYCITRNGRPVLVLSKALSTTSGKREVVFLDAESLEPNLLLSLDQVQVPEQIDWFDFDATGRYLLVMGRRTASVMQNEDGPQLESSESAFGVSILESQSQWISCFSVLDTKDNAYVLGVTDGSSAQFHPTRTEVFWVDSEELKSLDLLQSIVSSVLNEVVVGSFSPDGEKLSVVDLDGNLVTYDTRAQGLTPLGLPLRLQIVESIPDILGMGYNQSGDKIRIAYSGYTSYYANSPGCTGCSSTPASTLASAQAVMHLVVVAPQDRSIERIFNILLNSPELVLRETTFGSMTGSTDYETISLGPIPFGTFKSHGDYVMTVIQEDQGDAYSLAHRVEIWNAHTGRPAATSVLVGPPGRSYTPIVELAVLPSSFRIFVALEDGRLGHFDISKREGSSVLDYTDPLAQQLLIALAGKEVMQHGGVVDVPLSARIDSMESSRNLIGSQQDRSDRAELSENTIGVQACWHHSPKLAAVAGSAEVQDGGIAANRGLWDIVAQYPEVERLRFDTGYEYEDGLILKVADESRWLQLSKRRRLMFELGSHSTTDENIELHDEGRGLLFQLPLHGGRAMIKGVTQKQYEAWRTVTVVANR